MDEKPKSIWKKSWTGRSALLIWALLIATAILLGILIPALVSERPVGDYFGMAAVLGLFGVGGCFVIIYVVWPLLRWLFWKHWRRTLFALACFATLIALFYAEEDWRGWHAWNSFKHEWEAKGEHFDFASAVPPPVPDEQNFALTPVVASCYDYILTRDGKKIPYEQRDTNLVNRLAFEIYHQPAPSIPKLDQPKLGNWAKGDLTELSAWQKYYRVASYTNRLDPDMPIHRSFINRFPIAAEPQSPGADVLLALSKYDATIEELRQASQLPQCRFPLNYDTECPAAILLPPLAAMKSSIQLLQLRALAELQNGQPEKALADVKLMLRLTEAIRTEPFLISHLVRIAMWQITLQPIYEGLAEHRWSNAQLVALGAEMEKLDFLADYKLSIRGEIGLHSGIVEYLRRHPKELSNMTSDRDQSGNSSYAPVRYFPDGWFYQNLLHSARFMVLYYLPTVDLRQRAVSKSLMRQADEAFGEEIRHITPYNFLERVLLPALGSVAEKFAYMQASVDLARTAIALERYRLAHGEFPESLDALAPQFIAKVPHDVIGGQSLKYRRTNDGQFVLYSVGWNEQDDGGVVVNQKSRNFRDESSSKVDISQGDWVWRYPQK